MPEPIFMKLGIYIMAPESILTAQFEDIPFISLCLYVYPPIVARQRFGRNPLIVARQRLGKKSLYRY
jgi:hypothetical protein